MDGFYKKIGMVSHLSPQASLIINKKKRNKQYLQNLYKINGNFFKELQKDLMKNTMT